ncbi:hypothetical protein GCM10025781_12930 [Kocuria gwangalliensis]|uniref:Lactococcin 972 family bacteriocin n=1 Tax=Kocuria gwangalliensis TaxID=501592 RepID=A0ABP8WXW2_9MICC
MKRLKKALVTVGLAGTLAAGAAGAANAAVTHPGGGTWDSGVSYWTNSVWSNYHHPTRAHGSTACNSTRCNRSATVAPNRWSYASITASLGGNTTYWRY